jgi:hypothetical protein
MRMLLLVRRALAPAARATVAAMLRFSVLPAPHSLLYTPLVGFQLALLLLIALVALLLVIPLPLAGCTFPLSRSVKTMMPCLILRTSLAVPLFRSSLAVRCNWRGRAARNL